MFYQLEIKNKNRDVFRSKIVEAETHRQALEKIKKIHYIITKQFSDFELLDNIGVIQDK